LLASIYVGKTVCSYPISIITIVHVIMYKEYREYDVSSCLAFQKVRDIHDREKEIMKMGEK